LRDIEIEHRHSELERKRKTLEAQVNDLRATFEAEEQELRRIIKHSQLRESRLDNDRRAMGRLRQSEDERVMNNGLGKGDEENIQKESGKKTAAKRIRQ